MIAVAYAMVPVTPPVTGSRPVVPAGARRGTRMASVRAVRTRSGVVLFDEQGRLVGRIVAPHGKPAFGPGAEDVLLRRGT